MILQSLHNWQEFADRFIPMQKDSIQYVMRNPEECYFLDQDKVLERERKLTMIRNCICASTLRRPFKECTTEEIALDKYNRLMALIEKRPELKAILESKL